MSELKSMLRKFYNDLSDIRHEADKLQKENAKLREFVKYCAHDSFGGTWLSEKANGVLKELEGGE